MPLVDLLNHLVESAPTMMSLFVALGAGLLWSRTRRASTLAQFISSVLLLAGLGLYELRWRFTTPFDHSAFADVMRSESMRVSISLAQFIGIVAFAISYLCYALRRSASNQAMQRTAPRSDA